MSKLPSYVVITPARNEERFIELTIESMIAQTERPLRWVVVSDGSTDRTDEIVKRYAAEHPWIQLVQMPPRTERNFAGKVLAFNAGQERVKDLNYEVIGCLDGDTSFDRDYFSFLLQKLKENPRLGLTGTPFQEGSKPYYDFRFVNIEHVSGICQLFRRQCFEDIGGYVPIKGGGIDYVAVVSCRMKGWKTRTFVEKVCNHHREIGTAQAGWWASKFRYGVKDYALGNHPVWELSRVLYQMTRQPKVIGGISVGCGYVWAAIRRTPRSVPDELAAFTRCEQMQRLRDFVTSRIPGFRRRALAAPLERV